MKIDRFFLFLGEQLLQSDSLIELLELLTESSKIQNY